jgi:hypothetical protein
MKNKMAKWMCGVGVVLMVAGMFAAGASAQDQDAKPAQDEKPASDAGPKIQRWTDADLAGMVPAPKPSDVASPTAIVAAAYNVISGPQGGERDWNRFKSLFLPTGRLGTIGHGKDGATYVIEITPQEYVGMASGEFEKEGFFENGVVNKINKFGDVTEVFSSYESRHEKGGEVFARGINNFQCMFDGKRWWIESIVWDEEHDSLKLPANMAGSTKAAATEKKKEEGK